MGGTNISAMRQIQKRDHGGGRADAMWQTGLERRRFTRRQPEPRAHAPTGQLPLPVLPPSAAAGHRGGLDRGGPSQEELERRGDGKKAGGQVSGQARKRRVELVLQRDGVEGQGYVRTWTV